MDDLPLYDHYEFTEDLNFLKNVAYPMMKGSVQFVLDYLIKSPEGYLVTNPSHSLKTHFRSKFRDQREITIVLHANRRYSHCQRVVQ